MTGYSSNTSSRQHTQALRRGPTTQHPGVQPPPRNDTRPQESKIIVDRAGASLGEYSVDFCGTAPGTHRDYLQRRSPPALRPSWKVEQDLLPRMHGRFYDCLMSPADIDSWGAGRGDGGWFQGPCFPPLDGLQKRPAVRGYTWQPPLPLRGESSI
jgi:hypothetical protein